MYAGDLNAIQDAVAALTDFSQTLSVGTVRVGETGLQLLRYGSGEARLSGALRTDGILRALSGLYAGAYTTTQRDAIALGSRPYGLVILNTTTNRLEINLGTDSAPTWQGLGSSITSGTLAARPAPSASNANTQYFANDDAGGTLYFSNGSSWIKITAGLTSTPSPHHATHEYGGSDQVTVSKGQLAADVPVVPIGATLGWPWAGASIPAWSVLPYGQALSRTNYATLFSLAQAAGLIYGAGDNSTTFNVLDERGRVEVGRDDMGGTAANRITAAISGVAGTVLGAVLGAEGVTLTTAQIPAHNHGVSDPGHSHTYQKGVYTPSFSSGSQSAYFGAYTTDNTSSVGTGISIQNTGGGGAHQNVQPSIIVNRILRVI